MPCPAAFRTLTIKGREAKLVSMERVAVGVFLVAISVVIACVGIILWCWGEGTITPSIGTLLYFALPAAVIASAAAFFLPPEWFRHFRLKKDE
jgi:drug/metabolite transporter (DMT)-like permease